MKTEQLLSLVKIKKVYGELPKAVTNITIDSREVNNSSIFVAMKGLHVDGFDFIDDAIKRGCQFILSDRVRDLPDGVGLLQVKDPEKVSALFSEYIYDFPHESMTMIGVTGTNGKTTVSSMIHNLSLALGKKTAYLGTNGFMLSEEHFVSANTTPETTRLHKRLKEAEDKKMDVFTMEVSSHGLKLGRIFGISFDIVIFTNLSQDHLDFHRNMDEYGYTKGLLFSQLGQDLHKRRYVILNDDDRWAKEYQTMTPYEVITFGRTSNADFYPTDIKGTLESTEFTLNTPEGAFYVHSPYVGEYNISNLMCAIISEWVQGYEMEEILKSINQMKPVSGRLEVLDKTLPIDLIIDFAHSPDALEKILETVMPFKKGKLLLLVGMTGERDYSKGEAMGRIASQADYVFITVDNPGNDNKQMLIDLLEKGMTHNNYETYIDREEAINRMVEFANEGDTLLLVGKGREPYQIMEGHVKVPHRDDLIVLDVAYRKYKSDEYEEI